MVWLIVLWCFLGTTIINYSYAEEYSESDMNAVSMSFCDEGIDKLTSSTLINIEPGKEKKLCLYVANGWNKKMIFEYGFTPAKSIADWTDQVCIGDATTGNALSMLIPQTKERTVVIDPMSYKTIEEDIVIPPGMSWLQLWCLIYQLKQPETKDLLWWMFKLVVRRVKYLNIIVGWESTVKSDIGLIHGSWWVFSTDKNVNATVDEENNMKLSFLVKNDGNISQMVTITGKMYNALWFQQSFVLTSRNVAPWTTTEFATDAMMLPAYKWFFSVKYHMVSEPQFLFPISNEDLKKPTVIAGKASIFVFSWIFVAILVVILFLIYRALKPRRARIVEA